MAARGPLQVLAALSATCVGVITNTPLTQRVCLRGRSLQRLSFITLFCIFILPSSSPLARQPAPPLHGLGTYFPFRPLSYDREIFVTVITPFLLHCDNDGVSFSISRHCDDELDRYVLHYTCDTTI